MLKRAFIFFFIITSLNSWAGFNRDIYNSHEALFEAFLPFNYNEIDTTLDSLIEECKIKTWEKIRNNTQLRAALLLLSNIHTLHNSFLVKIYYMFIEYDPESKAEVSQKKLNPIREFLRHLANHRFFLSLAELDISERLELLSLMLNSEINFIRRIAFYLQLFYLDAIYRGPIGAFVSGIESKEKKIAAIMPPLPKLNSHLKYNPYENIFEGQIDVIIVGSGASASIAANQLHAAGLRVLVLEKGPMVIPGAIETSDNFRFLESNGQRVSENGSIMFLNANVAGGGPTINIDLSFPPSLPYIEHRFNQWHEQNIIPNDLWHKDQIKNAYKWVKKVFEPRKVSKDELNENNAILYNGARALGIPSKWFDLNTYENGDSPHEVSSKKSSFEKLLLPAMLDKNNPLTLIPNCKVTKVIKKDGKAKGVKCEYLVKDRGVGLVSDPYDFNIPNGTKLKLYAKHIILAAGNLGTTGILLNSKIRNHNIGHGFVVHPFVPVGGSFDKEINANQGLPSSIFVDHFMQTKEQPDNPGFLLESAAGDPVLGALLMPGAPRQIMGLIKQLKYVGGLGVILADSARYKNRIEKDSKGNLRVYYNLSKEDKNRFITGIKTAINILFAAGASDVFFHTYEKPMFLFDKLFANSIKPQMDLDELFDDFEFLPNKNLLMGAHMMGSNKMGIDPKNSVVDPNYRVWGFNNLYIIDSSIFPTSVGANPMQTIYTVAKIFADKFLNSLGEKYN